MAGTFDVGEPPSDEVVELDPSESSATAGRDSAEQPWWRRFGAAFLKSMRPDGAAVWRHPPRGA